MVLCGFRRQQNLLVVERRPEGVSHLAGRGHGGVEIRAAEIEADLARDHGLVKGRGDAECGRHLGEQSAAVAAVVKVGLRRARRHANLIGTSATTCGAADGFRGPLSHRIIQTLPGKFILRIEVQRGAKLGQRLDLAALAHLGIAPLQVVEHQLLPGQLARRHDTPRPWEPVAPRFRTDRRPRPAAFRVAASAPWQRLRWHLSILFWMDCRRPSRGNLQDRPQAAQWLAGRRQARGRSVPSVSRTKTSAMNFPPRIGVIVTGKRNQPESFTKGSVPSCIRPRMTVRRERPARAKA